MDLEHINQIAARQLTEQEILILKLRLTMSASEIGAKLSLSRQRVTEAINKAEAKIKAQGYGVADNADRH